MAANDVTPVHIQTFESTVRYLSQQMRMKMEPWVMFRAQESGGHNWERLAQGAYNSKTPGTKTATPEDGDVFSRRQSVPLVIDKGELVTQEDIVQTLIDPKSALAKNQVYAMYRGMDDEVFDAVDRAASDGAGGTVALPAGQKLGDGSTSISYDLITAVGEIFDNNDVDQDAPKCFVISPAQKRKLLQLTEATSADYNALRPLEEGKIAQWMGYSWIVSTRLNSTGAGKATCLAMTADAVGFNINQGITAHVAQDPGYSFDWRIYTNAVFGAVRVHDERVVTLDLSETI